MPTVAFNRLRVCNTLDKHHLLNHTVVNNTRRAAVPWPFEERNAVDIHMGFHPPHERP